MAALRASKPVPTIAHERSLIDAGHRHVAGVDEVGRGALAGPVVAAAVILRLANDGERARTCERLADVRDSKMLLRPARTRLGPLVESEASAWSLGWALAEEIDSLGIGRATWLAMRRALEGLAVRPDAVLVDGRALPSLGPWAQQSIVRGDGTVLSIAAASIVAKVRRDAWMIRLGEACPGFGFADHKGYGATSHREAIRARGPTPHHRLTWRLLPGEAVTASGQLLPAEAVSASALVKNVAIAKHVAISADERSDPAARTRPGRPQATRGARGGTRGRTPGRTGLDDPGTQLALPAG